MCTYILQLIGEQLPLGIPILYRADGGLFKLNRFKAKTKAICELQYTDGNIITAHSMEDPQGILKPSSRHVQPWF